MWGGNGTRKHEGEANRCDATGKVSYESNRLATHAMIGFKQRRGDRGTGKLQVFPCGDHFHIGNARINQNSRSRGKTRYRR
jgi:hypothetical protein